MDVERNSSSSIEKNELDLNMSIPELRQRLESAFTNTSYEISQHIHVLQGNVAQRRVEMLVQAALNESVELVPLCKDAIMLSAHRSQRIRLQLVNKLKLIATQSNYFKRQNTQEAKREATLLQEVWNLVESAMCAEEDENNSAVHETQELCFASKEHFDYFCKHVFVNKQLHKEWNQHQQQSNEKAALDEALTFLLNTLRSKGAEDESNNDDEQKIEEGKQRRTKSKVKREEKEEFYVEELMEEEHERSDDENEIIVEEIIEDEDNDNNSESNNKNDKEKSQKTPVLYIPKLVSLTHVCSEAPWIVKSCDMSVSEYLKPHTETTTQGTANSVNQNTNKHAIGFLFTELTDNRLERTASSTLHALSAQSSCLANDLISNHDTLINNKEYYDKEEIDDIEYFTSATKNKIGSVFEQSTSILNRDNITKSQHQQQHHEQQFTFAANVVRAISQVIDSSWSELEISNENVELLSRHTSQEFTKSINYSNCSDQSDDEMDLMYSLLDILRIRFIVYTSARLLAMERAKRLILEGEDGSLFESVRTLNTIVPCQSKREKDDHTDKVHLVPFTLLNLPGTENVFYCITYTIGVALWRDYVAQTCQCNNSVIDLTANEEEEEEWEQEQRNIKQDNVEN